MSFEQYFAASPFALVADREAARHWSGRPKALLAIQRLLGGMQTRPDSTVDVIWASFGAGKTHTLYYLINHLDEAKNICGVVEAPDQIKRFHDLYKLFMQTLPLDRMAQSMLKHARQDTPQNLRRAAQLIVNGNSAEKSLALQWLCGERPNLNDLRRVANISARIEDDIGAVEALSALVRCFASAGVRVCMLIDEYQRIGKLPERVRVPITSSLRTIISKNPKGFSIVLSITSLIEKTALEMVPNELKTIIGIRPVINLPPLSEEEALEFVKDRFQYCRPPGFSGKPFEPFTKETVETCIRFLAKTEKFSLTPRLILQTLGEVFDQQIIQTNLLSSNEALKEFLSQRNGSQTVMDESLQS